MIPKSGNRFSEKIMRKQEDETVDIGVAVAGGLAKDAGLMRAARRAVLIGLSAARPGKTGRPPGTSGRFKPPLRFSAGVERDRLANT